MSKEAAIPATVHPINKAAAGSQADTAKPERVRAKPVYVLPTDRIGIDKQLTLLRGYAAISGHSNAPVKVGEAAEVSKISATTVSLANGFFLEIGLLLKTETGFFPSEEVLAFARAYEWNPDSASLKLAPVIQRSWFAQRLLPKLKMGRINESEAITDLGGLANVGPDFRPRIRLVLDFLIAAGLAEREGEFIKQTATGTSMTSAGPAVVPEATERTGAAEPKEPSQREGQVVTRSEVSTGFRQMTGGAVHFNITVKVDMDEFADWKPERITAFFGGIAAVLSAKAAVEKAASDE